MIIKKKRTSIFKLIFKTMAIDMINHPNILHITRGHYKWPPRPPQHYWSISPLPAPQHRNTAAVVHCTLLYYCSILHPTETDMVSVPPLNCTSLHWNLPNSSALHCTAHHCSVAHSMQHCRVELTRATQLGNCHPFVLVCDKGSRYNAVMQ